ncbi:hypothetical protein ABH935_003466 [Catenulispora sp. GAS73]|uniref:DUF4129 domain-containing transglutaminase family protein n=1 Tax=Catenulispora sp. GAS73 TaxID=3156269 RepID=UPI0035165B94
MTVITSLDSTGEHQSLWWPEPEQAPPSGPPTAARPRTEAPAEAEAGSRSGSGLAVYAQSLLVCAAVVTANLVYLRYYGQRSFLVGTSAAAAGGVALTALTVPRRWPALVKLLLSAVGFTLVGVFAVYRQTLRHGVPTGHSFSALGSGLRSGWAEMLSANLPADAVGDLVVGPALIAWLAAAVSTALLMRTRTPLPPLIGPVAAFGAGLLFTAGRPVADSGLAAALVAELALLAVLRAGTTGARRVPRGGDDASGSASSAGSANPGDSGVSPGPGSLRAAAGRLAFGLPVVVVAAAVAVAGAHLTPVASGKNRYDLRDHVPVRLDVGDSLSPLVLLKPQLTGPDRDLFTVRVSGDPAGLDRVRTAALDDYDGALWTSSDRFLLAGHELPPDTAITDPRRIGLSVTVDGLTGSYLPEAGVPVQVTAPRFGYSTGSATLATDAPSIAGLHYDLTADVAPTAGLDGAIPSEAGGAAADTTLPPGLPPAIRAEGALLAGSVAQPYAKLLAIQDYLRKLPYNLDTRPGHSYDALSRLFSADSADRAGYAEQFAAAFAVLARSQGFPARVAVGYLLNPAHKHGDTYTVTAHDAHAWPEVDLAGYGWVAFEPTDPQHHTAVPPQPQKQKTTTTGTDSTPTPKQAQPAVDPNLKTIVAVGVSALDWALFVLVGIGAVFLLTPITIAMEKLRRRRVRRTGSRAARVIGAWQDAVDRLAEHGLPMSAAATAQEVAERAAELFGERAAPVAALAPLMMSAAYNPMEPDDATVAEAWALSARLRRELRSSRGLLRAFGAWFDPRPLVARSADTRRRRRALAVLTKG